MSYHVQHIWLIRPFSWHNRTTHVNIKLKPKHMHVHFALVARLAHQDTYSTSRSTYNTGICSSIFKHLQPYIQYPHLHIPCLRLSRTNEMLYTVCLNQQPHPNPTLTLNIHTKQVLQRAQRQPCLVMDLQRTIAMYMLLSHLQPLSI